MAIDKLKPNDPRAPSATATVRGKTYHYLHAKPPGTPRATAVLVHGWPDLSYGWRYQVPYLLSLGLEVLVPDMLGYGGTDAPDALALYSLKSASDDLAALVRHALGAECCPRILLGGHDWGGMVAWRFALWHPDLLLGVFSICTPYMPILTADIDLPALVDKVPNFRYQLQLAGPDVEREIGRDPAKLRGLLCGTYGARGADGSVVFTTERGVLFENVAKMGKSPLLDDEETDFYVERYARNGMRGPLNWYRTRKINFEEELALLQDGQQPKIHAPALMVTASRDSALPPRMTKGMEAFFDDLQIKEVNGTHWSLWGRVGEETNEHIGAFVHKLLGGLQKASI